MTEENKKDIVSKLTNIFWAVTTERRYLGAAVLFSLLLLVPGQDHGLWRTSEARDCEIAREMMVTGNLAVPHFNGQVFLEKPPLFYLSLALFFKLFGLDDRVAALPAILFAALSLLGVAMIGRRLAGEKLGLAMVIILGTTNLFLLRGHEAYLDMALTAAVIWSLVFFLFAYHGHESQPRLGYLLLFYFLLTVAFFIKGLVGPLTPLLTVGTYLLWQRDFRGLYRLKPWLGLLIFLLLALPWHYELWRQAEWKYLSIFYLDNHLYRFIHSSKVDLGHHDKWYWHLKTIWKFYAPWSALLPPALLAFFRREFQEWFPAPARKFLLSWLLPAFLFFTISSTKREDYLLPIYGALAGVIAAWLLFRAEKVGESAWERYYFLGFALVIAGLAVYVPAAAFRGHQGSWVWFALVSLIAGAAAVLLLFSLLQAPSFRALPLLLFTALIAGFAASALLIKVSERDRDQSAFCKKVAALTRNQPALYALGPSETERGLLGFYCQREVVNLEFPPNPRKFPPPGQRFPVAIVARTREQVEQRRAALVNLGLKIEEELREEISEHRLCVLWWLSPENTK